MIQIEAKSDEKPQFASVNEDFEEDFKEELDQKMSFAKLSFYTRIGGRAVNSIASVDDKTNNEKTDKFECSPCLC